jgi:acetylornithine deacetylase/succinyl-diaminopimelate desuccinylase-like protein
MKPICICSLFAALASVVCAEQDISVLARDPTVMAALAAAQRNEAGALAEQADICQIPAPPFKETERGTDLKRRFQALGLTNVQIDKVGNVIGTRPGRAERPNLVMAAHLDTVFPDGTNVHVTREGTVLKGPGIGDDCRGLAVLLATIRALDEAHVVTPGTITFVANVGEEGLGDLRGAKNLFQDSLHGRIDKFVSIDGTGLGITNIGVGSLRYRVTFKGPGGHSYGAFGMANPIHGLGRAIAKISDFQVPATPKTTFNVGRIGGGTSINAIPYEAWMEVDMRSADSNSLKALDGKFQAAVAAAVKEENDRWNGNGRITGEPELVGIRPAGLTPVDSPIVQTALAVSRALGIEERLREGSTDSNVPMSLGIPAITISGGGRGTGAHALNEAFDSKDSWQGTQRAVLLAIALAR